MAQSAPPDELIQYIQDAKKAGLKTDQIRKNALAAGWEKAMLDRALELVDNPQPGPVTAKVANPKPDVERDAVPAPVSAPVTATENKPAPAIPSTENKPNPATAPPANATVPPAAATAPVGGVDRTMRDTYQIGEGDVLQISVWGEPAASVTGVVRPDGIISMPLIKDVRIAGMTPAQAEKVITEQLSTLIKSADVTVIVNQINSKKIFVVGGGVKKEGPISFTYRMTVMQALSEAGGLTDYAKRKKIYVLRNENGRQFKLPFDYDAVLRGEHTELNIPLQAGDTLVVPNH